MKLPEFFRTRAGRWAVVVVTTLAVSAVVLISQRALAPRSAPTVVIPTGSAPAPLADLDQLLSNQTMVATPQPGPALPARIEIEKIGLDIIVLTVSLDPEGYIVTPERYAAYWTLSSPLDQGGNTVVVGHNSTLPRPIFQRLNELAEGDTIRVTDQFGQKYVFVVSQMIIVQVVGAPETEANRTREYALDSSVRRLTLITCSPDETCPDRLIVLADPTE